MKDKGKVFEIIGWACLGVTAVVGFITGVVESKRQDTVIDKKVAEAVSNFMSKE